MNGLLFYGSTINNKKLSYNDDWRDCFIENSDMTWENYNLGSKRWLMILPKIKKYDLIIFLHSTNSNANFIHPLLRKAILFRKGKVVIFIGNEYKLIPEKINLIRDLEADFVASQLPQDICEWLYAETDAKVLSIPHALNPDRFKPEVLHQDRYIDIGDRSFEYPFYLGDNDRNAIVSFFLQNHAKYGLKVDLSTNLKSRFDRGEWADFLNSCRCTVSTEAGTAFLERDDKTRLEFKDYLDHNFEPKFEDVFQLFFQRYKNPISGKCISSRHFDSIGTKTCLIMFSGRFNDILKADEHYIALKKDYSNIDEVIDRVRDDVYRQKMVDRSYEYVLQNHTHKHRIRSLLDKVFE